MTAYQVPHELPRHVTAAAPATALHPVILTGIAINAAILALGVWSIHQGADAFAILSREDGLIEWLQFLCFTALAVLLAFFAADRWVRRGGLGIDVVALGVLSALVALAALEEISWFQRILAIDTPEFFQRHNRQSETNLHNLVVGDVSLHKHVLVRIIFIVGITHNLVLPLVARKLPLVRHRVESLGLYLPPLSAALSYLVLLALSQVLVDHPRRGELGEAFGAVHYLSTVFAAYAAGVGYGQPPVFGGAADRKRVSILFAAFMVFLVFVAWLLDSR